MLCAFVNGLICIFGLYTFLFILFYPKENESHSKMTETVFYTGLIIRILVTLLIDFASVPYGQVWLPSQT